MQEVLTPNGQVIDAEPKLSSAALRRLWRLSLLLEGATEIAQAAVNAHTQRRAAYQQAFEAACEDAGIRIPPDNNDVDIDWNTGDVRFKARQT